MEYRTSDGALKTYITKDAVISSGQSLSAVVDIEQLNIAGFQMPSSWTTAKLTFQVSADDVTYVDAVDASGNELQVTVSASKFVGVDLSALSGVRYLKVRSGTSSSPVNQAADRTISIVLTSNAEASAGGGGSTSQTAATVPTATTMQNAATANGNGTSLNVQGYATAILNITSSPAMSGGTIVNFEASTDDSEWQPILAHQIGVQGNQVLTTSTDGDYRINCAGFKSIRARISGYSAGGVTVKGYATPLSGPATTVGISGTVKTKADSLEVALSNVSANNTDLYPATDVSAYKSFIFQLTGTWSATVAVQGSNDNSTWVNVAFLSLAGNSSQTQNTSSGNGLYIGQLGFKYLRIRTTSYSSGTVGGILMLNTTPLSGFHTMAVIANSSGSLGDNATDNGVNPIKTGTKTNFDPQRYATGKIANQSSDGSGSTFVNTEGRRATYSASIIGLTPASAATDILTILGSSSKTIRVTRVEITGKANSQAALDLLLVKRSTADTGGTATNPTAVPHDSNESAATATIAAYTANPTVGTLVGALRNRKITVTTDAAAINQDMSRFEFGLRSEEPIILRGNTQQLAVNLNGASLPAGLSLNIDITWTEE